MVSEKRKTEHGSNLARLERATELKKLLTLNLSSRHGSICPRQKLVDTLYLVLNYCVNKPNNLT